MVLVLPTSPSGVFPYAKITFPHALLFWKVMQLELSFDISMDLSLDCDLVLERLLEKRSPTLQRESLEVSPPR